MYDDYSYITENSVNNVTEFVNDSEYYEYLESIQNDDC